MVDRIEKTRLGDPWQISATKETKEDKKRDEGGASGQESKDSFGETSDFIQALAKDPKKFQSEQIASTQIKGFVFRGVSTHREKAMLEVDIALSNGTLIQGAQIALSRQEGMRFLSRRPGEEIVVDQLVKGTFLTIARPKQDPPGQELPNQETAVSSTEGIPAPSPATRLSWAYYLGMGAMLFSVLLLIYLFTL